jgi:cytochrome d ubiquinol oxidase subunit I
MLLAALLVSPAGFIAVIAGWITTEVGRQPYIVYGLLRTAESASPIDTPAVAASLIAFIVVYFVVFGAGIFYIFRLFAHPPRLDEPDVEKGIPVRAAGVTPAPALGSSHPTHGH